MVSARICWPVSARSSPGPCSAARPALQRVRGMAAGLLTGALAVAAHAMAGGAVPPGAAVVLLSLSVLAFTVGAVAGSTDRTGDARCYWPCSPWVNCWRM